jgi:predicted O-methyltransferase YrrM
VSTHDRSDLPFAHLLPQKVRMRAGHLRDRLLTGIGLQGRGFFVPYPHAAAVDRDVGVYSPLYERFERQRSEFEAVVERIERDCAPALAGFGRGPSDPRWSTRMFPPRDGAVAYGLLRMHQPRRVLEIGSGNSTLFMARAVADGGFDCEITCIDPAPQLPLRDLNVNHVRRVLLREDEALVGQLGPGDVLFIDSSHIMLQGLDVDIEFNLMFPRLASGTIVHVHDIFLPFPYPSSWELREYSEQNALFGWIYSGFFEVIYPSNFVNQVCGPVWDRLAARVPALGSKGGGSMWLRRR